MTSWMSPVQILAEFLHIGTASSHDWQPALFYSQLVSAAGCAGGGGGVCCKAMDVAEDWRAVG
jgi:hypothetical protein